IKTFNTCPVQSPAPYPDTFPIQSLRSLRGWRSSLPGKQGRWHWRSIMIACLSADREVVDI
ncbi:MAG: hypothetical protein ACE5EE_04870, partial [Fidelibacterota bacterium]